MSGFFMYSYPFSCAIECFDPAAYVQLIIDGAASIKEEIAGRPKAGILDKGMTVVLEPSLFVARKYITIWYYQVSGCE
jgi:hypothetical protein